MTSLTEQLQDKKIVVPGEKVADQIAEIERLQGAVKAIRLEEREACAMTADGFHDHAGCGHGGGYMNGRHDAAAAIRVRL